MSITSLLTVLDKLESAKRLLTETAPDFLDRSAEIFVTLAEASSDAAAFLRTLGKQVSEEVPEAGQDLVEVRGRFEAFAKSVRAEANTTPATVASMRRTRRDQRPALPARMHVGVSQVMCSIADQVVQAIDEAHHSESELPSSDPTATSESARGDDNG